MKTQNRTMSLLQAILFFFILFITSGQDAYAADLDHENDALMKDIPICCEWDDEENKDGTRPDHVTVTLYANGRETGRKVTLREENSWRGCFENMDTHRNGEMLSYSIIEERVDGYTGTIEGSDSQGYRIVNIHEPLPEGRNSSDEITPDTDVSEKKGVIVETVVTTKVSKSIPARTSTSTKKSRSAKTADASDPVFWELMVLASCAALYLWMRIEQSKE